MEQVRSACSRLPKPSGGQVGRQVGGAFGVGVSSVLILTLLAAFSSSSAYAQGGGNALDFDGVNDHVTRTYDSDFDFGTGSFTVSGWFKTSSSTTSSGSVSVRVAASSDDAEEQNPPDGSMSRTSSDLELVVDDVTDQEIGMRFLSVGLLQGANITNAYIQFTADANDEGATTLTFYGEDTDDALTFSSSDGDITGRTNRTAPVAWNSVPAWTSGAAGDDQKTPDLKTIIQQIVDRPGWSDENALVIIVDGTGERTACSYDGDAAKAPLLVVEYGDEYLVSRYDDDQGFKVWMQADGKIAFGLDDDSDWSPGAEITSTSSYKDTWWHHFAAVKDGNSAIRLYIDGSQVASNSSLFVSGSVSKYVAASEDDAEEPASGGAVDLGSSDLELIYDSEDQQVGIRFNNITILQGATITSAYIQFTADSDPKNNVPTGFDLTFYAEDIDDAPEFTTSSGNITSRTKTTNSVTWSNVPTWTGGLTYNTADISSVIEEVVERAGWASGNSIAIIVTGTAGGTRNAESYGNGVAPLLVVNYTTPFGTLTSDSAPLTFGSDEPTNADYFDGVIDEVRIWNDARTETEIRDWMHKTEGLTDETGLVSVWHLNESTVGANSAVDSKSDNHGTPTNMGNEDCITSTAPFGTKGAFVATTDQT